MLENGNIIESGTHTELMKECGSYAEMYSMQAKNYLADEEVAV
jgi:ABC-type multidrug transport system fused ATPase/permease subunit